VTGASRYRSQVILVLTLVLAFPQAAGDPAAARLSALDATCQAGRLEKCLEAGRGHLAAADPEAALGSYAKACTGGIAEACLGLASRYAGLADKARQEGRDVDAASHADKGLSLVRQAIKQKPNLADAVEYEAILCRMKAALAHAKAEVDSWASRAREAEARAVALRAVMGASDSPDLFWRPTPPKR
jgi:hypothetical protein